MASRFSGWTRKLFGGRLAGRRTWDGPSVSKDFVQLDDRIVPATFLVTNILDNQIDTVGGLSLRQAILAANANPGFDRIEFRIPTSPSLPTLPDDPSEGYFPIVLATTLPDLTDPAGVTIDATTQPRRNRPAPVFNAGDDVAQFNTTLAAYNFKQERPLVQLLPDPNPGAFPDKTGAFFVSGQNNAIRGFVVTGFSGSGINLVGPNAKNNILIGNWVNTDINGTANWINDPIIRGARPPALEPELANNYDFVLGGITLSSGANRNIIGGAFDLEGRTLVDAGGMVLGDGGTVARYSPGSANLEKDPPITVSENFTRNIISGTPEYRKDYFFYHYHGTDPSEHAGSSLFIDNNDKFRERDIDGAQAGGGIRLLDPGTTFNLIQGNYIGTDVSGTLPIPNVNGIEIMNSASSNYVGNPVVPEQGNLIRFNELDGIHVAPHPNPSQRSPLHGMPLPIPRNEGDDVTTIGFHSKNTVQVIPVTPVLGGYGPPPGGSIADGGTANPAIKDSAPFFDSYNPNYFTGGAPTGGEIILLANNGVVPGLGPTLELNAAVAGGTTVGIESQVGTDFTIRGNFLGGATAVGFKGANGGLVQAKFIAVSDTELTVTIPEGAVNGAIQVFTPAGVVTSPAPVTILPSPAPSVNQVSQFFPSSGVVGDTVTIVGQNFQGTQQVLIGGVPASKFFVRDLTPGDATDSATQIEAVVPVGAKTDRTITVVTPAGQAVTSRAFVVLTEPPPTINGVKIPPGIDDEPLAVNPDTNRLNPANDVLRSARPGDKVVLTGTGFTGAFLVTFSFVGGAGGFSTTDFEILNENSLLVTVPPNASPSLGPIQVTSASGFGLTTEVLPGGFQILEPSTPAVSGLDTQSAEVGATVTIQGTGFTSVNGVFFGAVPAQSFTINPDVGSGETITAVVPLNGDGFVRLTTVRGETVVPDFDLAPSPRPTLTGLVAVLEVSEDTFTDRAGPIYQNNYIRLTGTGLTSTTQVLFGNSNPFFGIASPDIRVESDTSVLVLVPVGGSTGQIFLFNAAAGVGADGIPNNRAAIGITVTNNAPPIINTALLTDPVTGVVGQTITIRGAGLLSTQQVFFLAEDAVNTPPPPNGVQGEIESPKVVVISDNEITAVVPFGARLNPDGTRAGGTPVRIRTVNDSANMRQQVLTADFRLLPTPQPQINTFFAVNGPVGTSVRVTGRAFASIQTVEMVNRLDPTISVPVTAFTVAGDDQIVFRVPPGVQAKDSKELETGANEIADDYFIRVTAPGGQDVDGNIVSRTAETVTRDGEGIIQAGGRYFEVQDSPGLRATATQPNILSITYSTPGSVRNAVVSISGTGMAGTLSVTIGGAAATFEVQSDVLVTARVPLTANSGTISLTTPGGTIVSPTPFQILNANPPVISPAGTDEAVFTEDLGVIGSKFFITGTGLAGVFEVTVGGQNAEFFHDLRSGKLVATVPDGLPVGGQYTVAVRSAVDGDLSNNDSFRTGKNILKQTFEYGERIRILASPRPFVTGVRELDPDVDGDNATIVRGAPIEIVGRGFTGASKVTVGGVTAKLATGTNIPTVDAAGQPFINEPQYTIVNDNLIRLQVPIRGYADPTGAVVAKIVVTSAQSTGGIDSLEDVVVNLRPVDALQFVATSPGGLFAPVGGVNIVAQGEQIKLTATSGTFYEVTRLRVKALDNNDITKSYPFTDTVRDQRAANNFVGTDTPFHFDFDLGDPRPFQNFVVVPGTNGTVALATLPAIAKAAASQNGIPSGLNLTVAANHPVGANTDTSLFAVNVGVTPGINKVYNFQGFTGAGTNYVFNRHITIEGKSSLDGRGLLTATGVTIATANGNLFIPRENIDVDIQNQNTRFEVVTLTLTFSTTSPVNFPGVGTLPSGGITVNTLEGDATATVTPGAQPEPQIFEFLTQEAPAFGNLFLENQIYDNGLTVDPATRAFVAFRDSANKRTVGALGIDFVTGGTDRTFPYVYGFARVDQQEVHADLVYTPGQGNHGRGGIEDGLNGSFPGPYEANSFNNVVGGRAEGPNLLQNFPLLQVVQSSVDRTTFSTALLGKPFRVYRLDYYYDEGVTNNDDPASIGFDDTDATANNTTNAGYGQIYLGSKIVTTDAQGNGSASFQIFQELRMRQAQDPLGNLLENEDKTPVMEVVPKTPNEFRLPDNLPLLISAAQGGDGNSTNFALTGVVTATASDLTAPTAFGPTLKDGPDGTSRFSFFRRTNNSTGRLQGQVILDKNANGKMDSNENGVAGYTVNLYTDNGDGTPQGRPSGIIDPVTAKEIQLPILSVLTDETGNYDFGSVSSQQNSTNEFGLPNGRHLIEILPPANRSATFYLLNGATVQTKNTGEQELIGGTVATQTVAAGKTFTRFLQIVDGNELTTDNTTLAVNTAGVTDPQNLQTDFFVQTGPVGGGTVPPVPGVPPGPPVPPVPPVPPGSVPFPRGLAVGIDAGSTPTVNVYNPDGSFRYSFEAYDSGFTGGVRVAVGDVNGDGDQDIVTAPGQGRPGQVKVYNGRTGDVIGEFQPYEDAFQGGVYVSLGDINGDGNADVITGTGLGGGPRVQVFSLTNSGTFGTIANFFPYEDSFRGGVLVAAGDVNRDGQEDIVTGTGIGGGPRVQVFDGGTLAPIYNFFAYESTFRGGVYATVGDVDGTLVNGALSQEIITGVGVGGGPVVKVFQQDTLARLASATPAPLSSFFAYDPLFRGGVRVDVTDSDGNGRLDIVTGPGPGNPPNVRIINFATGQDVGNITAFDPSFLGGVFVGGTHRDSSSV